MWHADCTIGERSASLVVVWYPPATSMRDRASSFKPPGILPGGFFFVSC
jgi:hypothetical protein